MRFTREQYYALHTAAAVHSRDNLRVAILEITLGNEFFDSNYFVDFEVNWKSIGSVKAEDAILYAKEIQRTAAMVQALDALGIMVDYKDKTEMTADEREAFIDRLVEGFKYGNPADVLGAIVK